jgi:ATP-dependent helicase Lhr and Lhr-like helicase
MGAPEPALSLSKGPDSRIGLSKEMGAPEPALSLSKGPDSGTWESTKASSPSATEAAHALAMQLLSRYGVLLRESVAAENVPGGFSAVYDVLKALEESGRIRRGYFVAGLGATQFALPAAVDLLRQLRTEPAQEKPEFVQLAAADPANPYGSVLRWPDLPTMDDDAESGAPADRSSSAGWQSAPRILTRAAYAEVILRNGRLIAWLRRGNPNILVFLPADEPERSQAAAGLAHFLCARGQERMHTPGHGSAREGMLITTINGQPVAAHPMAHFLMDAGFHPGPLGMHLRRIPLPLSPAQHSPTELQ